MDNDRVAERREQIATVFPFPKPHQPPAPILDPDFVEDAADHVIRTTIARIVDETRVSLVGKSDDYKDGYAAAIRELFVSVLLDDYTSRADRDRLLAKAGIIT